LHITIYALNAGDTQKRLLTPLSYVHMPLVTLLAPSCGRSNISHGTSCVVFERSLSNSTSSPYSNHVPWAVISACIFTCALLILLLRFMLAAENKRRDAEKRDEKFDDIYLSKELSDGSKEEKRVDRVRLNLFGDYCISSLFSFRD